MMKVHGRGLSSVFFFNDTATTEIYTLSLHDALPISLRDPRGAAGADHARGRAHGLRDRKSTRLNSSHGSISYAVFCLKKTTTENWNMELTPTRGLFGSREIHVII